MGYTVAGLRSYYLTKWNNMVITRGPAVDAAARMVIAGMARYKDLEKQTGVPWKFIGVVHLRESNCNFHTHLHNGDPLSRRTYHVPAGRPLRGNPPFTFEFSAVDALEWEGFTKIKEWSIEQMAFSFEQYNGWGYRYKGIPSAYLWSGSNQYSSGKYIADGVFSPSAVDVQLGTMCVLKRICELTGEQPSTSAPPIPSNDNLKASDVVPGGAAIIPKPTTKEMNQTSRKFFMTDAAAWFTKGTLGLIAMVKALDIAAIQMTASWVSAIKQFAGENGLYIAVMALIAFALYATVLKDWMKQDVAEGRAVPSGAVPVSVVPASAELAPEAPAEPVQPVSPTAQAPTA